MMIKMIKMMIIIIIKNDDKNDKNHEIITIIKMMIKMMIIMIMIWIIIISIDICSLTHIPPSPLNQREKGEERDWEKRSNPIVEASVFWRWFCRFPWWTIPP